MIELSFPEDRQLELLPEIITFKAFAQKRLAELSTEKIEENLSDARQKHFLEADYFYEELSRKQRELLSGRALGIQPSWLIVDNYITCLRDHYKLKFILQRTH